MPRIRSKLIERPITRRKNGGWDSKESLEEFLDRANAEMSDVAENIINIQMNDENQIIYWHLE